MWFLNESADEAADEEEFIFMFWAAFQIWRSDGGQLFKKLQLLAEGFMDEVADLCNSRYSEILGEPYGNELISLRSGPILGAADGACLHPSPAATIIAGGARSVVSHSLLTLRFSGLVECYFAVSDRMDTAVKRQRY